MNLFEIIVRAVVVEVADVVIKAVSEVIDDLRD